MGFLHIPWSDVEVFHLSVMLSQQPFKLHVNTILVQKPFPTDDYFCKLDLYGFLGVLVVLDSVYFRPHSKDQPFSLSILIVEN